MALVRRARASSWIGSWSQVTNRYALAFSMNPRVRVAPMGQAAMPGSAVRGGARGGSQRDAHQASAAEKFISLRGEPRGSVSSPRYAAGRLERVSTQTLMRGIIERTRRIEDRVQVQTQLVSRSAAAGAASETQPAMHAKRTGEEWWNQDSGDGRRERAFQPGVNVEQITDNVLRQLDRRVGAWRERMGRM